MLNQKQQVHYRPRVPIFNESEKTEIKEAILGNGLIWLLIFLVGFIEAL